jgi:hypothetical protein
MVELRPLEASDKEQFIKDNQEAFNYGALGNCQSMHLQKYFHIQTELSVIQ